MKKLNFFAALCCAAAVFAACEKNDEPKNDSNNNSNNDQNEETTTGIENGHEYVDLGLPSGLKWATCNVGATSPEKYGNYYAWGETTTKSDYSWDTYKYGTYNYDGDYSKMTKYNATDGKTTLEAADDAATVNWGSAWRMPTDDEWAELITNCTWAWTDKNGVKGYEVKAINGNTIFLPAAGYRSHDGLDFVGYGSYWSATVGDSYYASYPNVAWNAQFSSGYVNRDANYRYMGHSVRPVRK